MPIYEFYCAGCHTLYNFFSPSVDTEAKPPCPRCADRVLERRPARFAALRHRPAAEEDEETSPFEGLDEERLERAMETVLEEVGELDEDADPRQLAQVFRKLGEASGLAPGPKMEEFLRRLEAGEDPEALESEMEEAFGDDESLEDLFQLKRAVARAGRRPRLDEEIYFL